jgi:glycine betaine/proline transport system permease protein
MTAATELRSSWVGRLMASIAESVEIQVRRPRRSMVTGMVIAGLLVGWVAIWFALRGLDTLTLGGQETTRLAG